MLRTLSGAAFLWLVLQHVLPKGFRRARNHGFLHPNSKRLAALLRLLVFRPRRLSRATDAARHAGVPLLRRADDHPEAAHPADIR